MAFDFRAWLKQPTTINGIALLIAGSAGTIAGMLTHNVEIAAGAGVLAGGLVHVAMPDNSAAAASVSKLVTDIVRAELQHRLSASAPQLIADMMGVVNDLPKHDAPPAPVVPVAAPVTPTATPVAAAPQSAPGPATTVSPAPAPAATAAAPTPTV